MAACDNVQIVIRADVYVPILKLSSEHFTSMHHGTVTEVTGNSLTVNLVPPHGRRHSWRTRIMLRKSVALCNFNTIVRLLQLFHYVSCVRICVYKVISSCSNSSRKVPSSSSSSSSSSRCCYWRKGRNVNTVNVLV